MWKIKTEGIYGKQGVYEIYGKFGGLTYFLYIFYRGYEIYGNEGVLKECMRNKE